MQINVKVTRFKGRKYLLMYYDDPLSGRRISRSTKQTTEKDARKAAAKWEAELQEGRYKAKSNSTWQEFRDDFLTEHLRDAPDSTAAAYTTALNQLEKYVAVKRLAELTAGRIAYAADQWRKEEKSPETVATYLRHLKAALNWACKAGMIHTVPAITMPKRQKGVKLMKGRPITTEEFERMLDKVEAGILACGLGRPSKDAKRHFCDEAMQRRRDAQAKKAKENATAWQRLLRGLWLSGLRLGEALNLSWDDESKILVELSGKRPMLRIMAHQQKGRRDTLLPMTPDFAEFLLATPEDQRTGPVFPLPGKRAGQIADVNYASRVISAAGEAAGVVVDKASGKFGSAHDLRRAFGFRWSVRVMPAVLKELMRHADVGTTMKFYAGQNAEAMADAVWEAASRSTLQTVQS